MSQLTNYFIIRPTGAIRKRFLLLLGLCSSFDLFSLDLILPIKGKVKQVLIFNVHYS